MFFIIGLAVFYIVCWVVAGLTCDVEETDTGDFYFFKWNDVLTSSAKTALLVFIFIILPFIFIIWLIISPILENKNLEKRK